MPWIKQHRQILLLCAGLVAFWIVVTASPKIGGEAQSRVVGLSAGALVIGAMLWWRRAETIAALSIGILCYVIDSMLVRFGLMVTHPLETLEFGGPSFSFAPLWMLGRWFVVLGFSFLLLRAWRWPLLPLAPLAALIGVLSYFASEGLDVLYLPDPKEMIGTNARLHAMVAIALFWGAIAPVLGVLARRSVQSGGRQR